MDIYYDVEKRIQEELQSTLKHPMNAQWDPQRKQWKEDSADDMKLCGQHLENARDCEKWTKEHTSNAEGTRQ